MLLRGSTLAALVERSPGQNGIARLATAWSLIDGVDSTLDPEGLGDQVGQGPSAPSGGYPFRRPDLILDRTPPLSSDGARAEDVSRGKRPRAFDNSRSTP